MSDLHVQVHKGLERIWKNFHNIQRVAKIILEAMLQEKKRVNFLGVWKGILCAVLYYSGALIAINFHPQTVKKKAPLCTTWIDVNMIVD